MIIEDSDRSIGEPEVPLISRSPYKSVFYYPKEGYFGSSLIVHR